ncbi:unnamed protein product, partial [Meganyctiphanes norvegica]
AEEGVYPGLLGLSRSSSRNSSTGYTPIGTPIASPPREASPQRQASPQKDSSFSGFSTESQQIGHDKTASVSEAAVVINCNDEEIEIFDLDHLPESFIPSVLPAPQMKSKRTSTTRTKHSTSTIITRAKPTTITKRLKLEEWGDNELTEHDVLNSMLPSSQGFDAQSNSTEGEVGPKVHAHPHPVDVGSLVEDPIPTEPR